MDIIKGKCGTCCNTCGFKEKFNCGGCEKMEGRIFWGECDIYKCATDKGYKHCGECMELPCRDLQTFIENGHNPDRLNNLKKWKHQTNTIDSRCGLRCSDCEYRESYGCGGCIETNGHPFHGECPVAKCCQDKGYMHCGECPDIPEACGVSDCKKKDANGFTLCDGCDKTTCGRLHAYSYTDPDHGDNPPGARVEQCKRWARESGK